MIARYCLIMTSYLQNGCLFHIISQIVLQRAWIEFLRKKNWLSPLVRDFVWIMDLFSIVKELTELKPSDWDCRKASKGLAMYNTFFVIFYKAGISILHFDITVSFIINSVKLLLLTLHHPIDSRTLRIWLHCGDIYVYISIIIVNVCLWITEYEEFTNTIWLSLLVLSVSLFPPYLSF